MRPSSTLRVDEEATVFGARSARLATPEGALDFAILTALDDACAGDGQIAVRDDGLVELSCLRPAAPGEECLGFIDESDNPPRWKCEDRCLADGSGNVFCGKTDHL